MVGSANWSACSFFAFLQVPHQLHFIIAIKTLSSRPREAVLLCAQSAATWTCTVIICVLFRCVLFSDIGARTSCERHESEAVERERERERER